MNTIILIPLIIVSLLPWQPQPGDENLIRGGALVVYQDKDRVAGYLPSPCHELRIDGEKVYSVLDPDAGDCLQTLTWFDVYIGEYHVINNYNH